MTEELLCLTCYSPLCPEKLADCGIVHCTVCDSRFLPGTDIALTHVDDIPDEEYLGG